MTTPTLFILCGEAFSGKSTLSKKIADQYGAKIVGRDEIYFATEKILALENTPDTDDDSLWNNLWPLVLQGVRNHLLLGHSVVIDDNCFYIRHREELRAIAQETGTHNVLIYLNVPSDILRKRKEDNKISKTRHDVPSEWMTEDLELFERPTDSENPIIYTHEDTFEVLVSKLDKTL